MANIEAMIKWMSDRKGKVTYSMDYRNGPNSYDCSSAVYNSLVAGGFFKPTQWIGNTDSLYGDLERNGWAKVPAGANGWAVKRGDIFLWGKQGMSGGAYGHTGIFLGPDEQMIHCNYGYNGITINDHDLIWEANGQPPFTLYRYNGSGGGSAPNPTPAPGPAIKADQIVDVGSTVKFPGVYRCDAVDVKNQAVASAILAGDQPSSANFIDTIPLIKTNEIGIQTEDQTIDVGDYFIIPGEYIVIEIDEPTNGALLRIGKRNTWVSCAPLYEIKD